MCRPDWHDNWPTSEIISAINIIWWRIIHSVVKIIISTINFIFHKHNSFAKCSTKCKTNFFFVFLWVKIFRNSVFTVFMSGRTEMEIFVNEIIEFDDESYCLLHLETHQQTLIMKWWKRHRTAAENVFLCYDRSRFSDSFTVYSVTKQPTNFFYFLFTPAGSCPVCVTGHGMCVIRCVVWMEIISETVLKKLVATVILFCFLVF